jgi:hypothetical protein
MATSDEKKLKTTEETNQDRSQTQPQEPNAAPQPNEQGNDQSRQQLDQDRQQNQDQADPNDPTVNDGSPGREQPTQPKEGVGGDHVSND